MNKALRRWDSGGDYVFRSRQVIGCIVELRRRPHKGDWSDL